MQNEGLKTISPLTRGLPKTGQEVSYANYDDGTYEAGWWLGLLNAANRTRFITKTLDGDDVVIDLATGLMWARDGDAAGCDVGLTKIWNIALNYMNLLDFAGFTDWRLPNILELYSLVDWTKYNTSIWDVFTNTKYDDYYWSSTTRAYNTTYAKALSYSEGTVASHLKISADYIRAVRKV